MSARGVSVLLSVFVSVFVLIIPTRPISALPADSFLQIDVWADAGANRLAAYQVTVDLVDGELVGVEGGDHPAFAGAPYYDPAALHGGRIKLAAFSTSHDLASGRVRVARLHVMAHGTANPRARASGITATDSETNPIEIRIDLASERDGGPR